MTKSLSNSKCVKCPYYLKKKKNPKLFSMIVKIFHELGSRLLIESSLLPCICPPVPCNIHSTPEDYQLLHDTLSYLSTLGFVQGVLCISVFT